MKKINKLEMAIYWTLLTLFLCLVMGAVFFKGSLTGRLLEGVVTISTFLAAFFSLCFIVGDPKSYSTLIRPRQIPIVIELVVLLLTGFVGWYLENIALVFSCLILVLTLKKVEAIRNLLLSGRDD
ncbi:membrane hypothetical protein [Vibrio nigripulchritudo FTn2]|uniref:hypothetical protein n=1 Tax=Vibrio nigripulchritudo TaxID=28173 RepID=UPI0003B1DDF1|nr:hypothetical protein [Vibrio nigripulchritudo]CCN40128.1 membrane hypothetical protein [Vibrio nigripulchritudo FTn2]